LEEVDGANLCLAVECALEVGNLCINGSDNHDVILGNRSLVASFTVLGSDPFYDVRRVFPIPCVKDRDLPPGTDADVERHERFVVEMQSHTCALDEKELADKSPLQSA